MALPHQVRKDLPPPPVQGARPLPSGPTGQALKATFELSVGTLGGAAASSELYTDATSALAGLSARRGPHAGAPVCPRGGMPWAVAVANSLCRTAGSSAGPTGQAPPPWAAEGTAAPACPGGCVVGIGSDADMAQWTALLPTAPALRLLTLNRLAVRFLPRRPPARRFVRPSAGEGSQPSPSWHMLNPSVRLRRGG